MELLCKEEVYRVTGAAMEVYNTLGPGFLEAVYQEALQYELTERGIPFVSQQELVVYYKGQRLEKTYTADMVVEDRIVVELKAKKAFVESDEVQLLNYLRATGLEVGLLLNFGAIDKLQWKRMIWTNDRKGFNHESYESNE